MNQETLLDKLAGLVPLEHRAGIRDRIERETRRHAAGDASRARCFLEDLEFMVRMGGPDFMYTRGVAASLHVNEELFELAYAVRCML